MKMALPALVLTLIAMVLTGCSSGKAQVTFTKPENLGSVYAQFPGAYITSNRDGEYDIVLVNDTLRSAGLESSKKPLQPIGQPPIEQAIHIHLFWRPVEGAMMKESSITNAIIHWYVFTTEGSRQTDMLHYQGAAFVTMSTRGEFSRVQIGDGQIEPKLMKGNLKDPVGPSRITGSIYAVRNDAKVRELLSSFQAKAGGNDPTWSGAETDAAPVVAK